MKHILAFQKVVVGDTRAAIMGLKDERHLHVLEKVHSGRARFRVLRKHIAHAKLYLLSNADGRTRVIIGSANLSERAFSGKQSETLVKFDDDVKAWRHYNRMLDEVIDSASDEIPLPEERISNSEIEISEIPVMGDASAALVIEPPRLR
ncbi:MAG TPA: phospholipase D family protein [Dehalococcoidia bacterium]|nr:phospholipase D family protein [Dehalococcoidia bacterium]